MIAQLPIAWSLIWGTLAPWASSIPPGTSMSTEDFSFNNYGLMNTSILTQEVQGLHDAGNADVWEAANNWQDGWRLLYREWRGKQITIKWIVKAASREALEAKIDEMKWQLDEIEWMFRYKTQWNWKEISATSKAMTFDRKYYHITFCPFSITLTINDVYWRYTDQIITTLTWLTANFNNEFSNVWNKDTYPKFILSVNSGSCTQFKMTLNGIDCTYASALTAGDVLVIDSKTWRVKKNWSTVDFTGPCPVFSKGPNLVFFDFWSWTFNIDINVKYSKNFL